MNTAEALTRTLLSDDLSTARGEQANVIDAIVLLSASASRIAKAITPAAVPGHDETGGTVASLTEATMGITAGLCRVADAISDLAAAVREHGKS